MNNNYRKMMEEVDLSPMTKEAIMNKMQESNHRSSKGRALRVAIVVLCLCIALPLTVFAADAVFGLGLIKPSNEPLFDGRVTGEGYDMVYDSAKLYPIEEFNEKWHTYEGYESIEYESIEDFSNDMGIPMLKNPYLDGYKSKNWMMDTTNMPEGTESWPVHCYANHMGKEGQYYGSWVNASYCIVEKDESGVETGGKDITLASTITAEHPTIPAEDILVYHQQYSRVDEGILKDLVVEEYTTAKGITVSIAIETFNNDWEPQINANLMVNGISYRLSISDGTSYYNEKVSEEAYIEECKAELYRVLDGFEL